MPTNKAEFSRHHLPDLAISPIFYGMDQVLFGCTGSWISILSSPVDSKGVSESLLSIVHLPTSDKEIFFLEICSYAASGWIHLKLSANEICKLLIRMNSASMAKISQENKHRDNHPRD
jgi:hypothetical protein